MKLITAYETSDKRLFKNKSKAKKHQKILDIKNEIYELLGGDVDPHSCDFANGDGYYQLTERNYLKSLKLVAKLKKLAGVPEDYSITSRFCYENEHTLSTGALIACIDHDTLRRYGQPYYKLHPQNCTSQKDWSIK